MPERYRELWLLHASTSATVCRSRLCLPLAYGHDRAAAFVIRSGVMLVRPIGGAALTLAQLQLQRARYHAATSGGRVRGYRGHRKRPE